jgi:thiol-disulfide isomerase/thioredoxin
MKNRYKLSTLLLILLTTVYIQAQDNKFSFPSVNIKTLDGETFNTSEIENGGKPILISFWATWCKPCIKELIAYDDNYDDWQEETGLKIIIISIDDSKSVDRVAPFVNGRGWEYESYLDENSSFKRAMNVINVPHSFLFDGNGKLIWQHTSYAEGDEDELYELLLQISN